MQNGFHQNTNKIESQKEHKADFGGFNMNIQRGTIQNGKAIPNPEKKKDDKAKPKKGKAFSSDDPKPEGRGTMKDLAAMFGTGVIQ